MTLRLVVKNGRAVLGGKPFEVPVKPSIKLDARALARMLVWDGHKLRIDPKTGVIWVVDPADHLGKAKAGLDKALIQQLEWLHGEEQANAEESEDTVQSDRWRKAIDDFRKRARVEIKPVTSPSSGKKGYKITITPTIDETRRKAGGR